MMYIRTNNKAVNKRNRIITLIVSIFAILIAFIQFLLPHFLPALFTTIARPFWRMEFSIKSGSLQSPEELLAENESLKRALDEMAIQNQSTDFIRSENSEILNNFGRSSTFSNVSSIQASTSIVSHVISSSTQTIESSSSESLNLQAMLNHINSIYLDKSLILGAVLAHPSMLPYDEMIIDVGSDQGIKPGSKVYAMGNVLIGTTTDVMSQTSKVILFSSPGQKFPVLIGSSNIPATAIGRGGGQYEAEIPQATKISEGDIIIDASLNDGPFATVTSVLSNPADPFETVLFSSPVNIYQIRWVLIKK